MVPEILRSCQRSLQMVKHTCGRVHSCACQNADTAWQHAPLCLFMLPDSTCSKLPMCIHAPAVQLCAPHLQAVYLGMSLAEAKKEWDAGEITRVHALTEFSKAQFWLEQVGLYAGVLFLLNGPVLFLPAARGSLLNTFFGVRYGVAIKWHRCGAGLLDAWLRAHSFGMDID